MATKRALSVISSLLGIWTFHCDELGQQLPGWTYISSNDGVFDSSVDVCHLCSHLHGGLGLRVEDLS